MFSFTSLWVVTVVVTLLTVEGADISTKLTNTSDKLVIVVWNSNVLEVSEMFWMVVVLVVVSVSRVDVKSTLSPFSFLCVVMTVVLLSNVEGESVSIQLTKVLPLLSTVVVYNTSSLSFSCNVWTTSLE